MKDEKHDLINLLFDESRVSPIIPTQIILTVNTIQRTRLLPDMQIYHMYTINPFHIQKCEDAVSKYL